jgi:APA family basic amino acid/polyamine antiporter
MRATMSSTPARTIGFWTAVSLVMGNMIASGVFLLPASLAPHGGLAIGGWLVSAAGAMLLALVFARLAAYRPAAGGPYAYTRDAYGQFAGFLVAWGYWISVWCANAAIAMAFVGYLSPFLPGLVGHRGSAAALAIATVWLLTLVNIRGVGVAGRLQLVTTGLKLLPLAFVGLAGLALVDPSHFTVADTSPFALAGGITASATLTLWAFLGLECATIPAGSVRDPARTIPRATVVGTLLAAVVYVLSTAGVMGLLEPDALARSTAPFADAARTIGGDLAARLIAAGAAISCFGGLNGWILIAGQLSSAVAADGLFPAAFARQSRYGTPALALVVTSGLTTALIATNASGRLVDVFTFTILLSTLSVLVPYAFCSLAGFLLARADPAMRMPAGASAVALLAFAYSLWAIGGAGADVVYWGFLLLLSGIPVYVWAVWR